MILVKIGKERDVVWCNPTQVRFFQITESISYDKDDKGKPLFTPGHKHMKYAVIFNYSPSERFTVDDFKTYEEAECYISGLGGSVGPADLP